MRPKRVQRKRTRGWKMPANTVYVGRPTRWGNPVKVWPHPGANALTNFHAKELYREAMASDPAIVAEIKKHLAGKNLACWCPLDEDCHADVLLEIANS